MKHLQTVFAAAALLLAALPAAAREPQLESRLGRYLETSDRLRIDEALDSGADYPTARWSNPARGVDYRFSAGHAFDTRKGICREFEIEARIDKRRIEAGGTACLDDGGWRIVE